MHEELLSLSLIIVLVLYIIFYVLSDRSQACFSGPSPTDKYSCIDKESFASYNKSSNWSGLDDSDKTTVMNITKNKLMMNQPPPLSITTSSQLIDQEFGKSY